MTESLALLRAIVASFDIVTGDAVFLRDLPVATLRLAGSLPGICITSAATLSAAGILLTGTIFLARLAYSCALLLATVLLDILVAHDSTSSV